MSTTLDSSIVNWIEERAELIRSMRAMEISQRTIDENIQWGRDYLRLVVNGEGLPVEPYHDLFEQKINGGRR